MPKVPEQRAARPPAGGHSELPQQPPGCRAVTNVRSRLPNEGDLDLFTSRHQLIARGRPSQPRFNPQIATENCLFTPPAPCLPKFSIFIIVTLSFRDSEPKIPSSPTDSCVPGTNKHTSFLLNTLTGSCQRGEMAPPVAIFYPAARRMSRVTFGTCAYPTSAGRTQRSPERGL